MDSSQRASPAAECCYGSGQIVLEKTRAAVYAGEEPEPRVAALPRCTREKRSHRRSGALPSQQAAEEIPPRTEERHQSLVHRPGIVTGSALERRRRNFSAAARTGKKRVDL